MHGTTPKVASGSDLARWSLRKPNKFVAEVHDRMPVILEAKDFEQWERWAGDRCCEAHAACQREAVTEMASVKARE